MEVNNEPWFVGKDVASVLGYANTRKALADHIDDEDKLDGVTIRDPIGREQPPGADDGRLFWKKGDKMNELQIFKYQDSEVRTIEMNGEPWFVLKDVCKVLAMDVTQLKKTADRLDADEKGRTQITTPGGVQETWVINESGLYNVILRSDKPEAKPFRKWVTSEVLPTIRKHGAYMTPETLQEAITVDDDIGQLPFEEGVIC